MTYPETIRYLDSFINYERALPKNYSRDFKLERMRSLLSALGNPHTGIRFIHVTGTKGKGSTAALIASVLKEANFSVGLYTSPHLATFRERIRIGGRMIEEDELSGIVEEIKPHLDKMHEKEISFFEVYTAIAFIYFRRNKVDFAVMEVGLGGRLDATNVIESKISVITPISFEHTRILGSTLKEIAAEKAGIIKENSVCISSVQEKEALDVIERVAREKMAELYLVGRDILIDKGGYGRDTQRFSVSGRLSEYPLLELRLRGEHQITNAACAVGAIEALAARYNLFIGQDAIRGGIAKAQWPGRMEIVDNDPLVVVDGAQNVASAKALALGIKRHFDCKKVLLILGICRDKDIEGICGILGKIADSVILTRADNPRAADPQSLKGYIKEKPCQVFLDSKDALDYAYSQAEKDDLVLVTGSLFLVGEIREQLILSLRARA